jgi:hypothetical protein
MYYFEVEVSYDGDGEKHHLGNWSGLARDHAHAEALAHDAHWEERLTAASCAPVYSTQQVCRFLVSEGWSHFFAGNTESATRWVLDRLSEKLAYAEVAGTGLKSSNWYPLSDANKDDLLESLVQANDILRDFANFGVEELDRLPEWAAQALEDQADVKVAKQRLAGIEGGYEKPAVGSSLRAHAGSARRAKP